MLDQTRPVQFVEGINENEEPTSGRFLSWGEYGIGIPYTAGITYSLAQIEVYGSPEELSQPYEHTVKIYTDHEDSPSNTLVVEGKLAIPSVGGEQWLPIKPVENVVILAQHKYWLCIEEHPLKFAIGIAENGEELSLRAYISQRWGSSQSGRTWKCMLRFYGRILTVSS